MTTATQPKVSTATIDDFRRQPPPEFVDDDRVYRATLYLGASRSWRTYRSGQWVKGDAETLPDGRTLRHYRHELATHKIGPTSGKIINGLIASHRKFLGQQPSRDTYGANGIRSQALNPDALVARALLVSDIREVDELPADETQQQRAARGYEGAMQTLARIAEALEKTGRK